MSRILAILFLSLSIFTSSFAGSDGENELSKTKNGEVKDCFETLNRGIFAFNQAIDGTIFEPLAKGYKYLPSPVRTGTSNFVGNVSTLLTIPNNVLQGDLDIAGKNTLRFIVNTTVGVVGLFDPASAIGLNSYEKEDFGQTLGNFNVVSVVWKLRMQNIGSTGFGTTIYFPKISLKQYGHGDCNAPAGSWS